ncbi:uncharacterized protein LOC143039427 [Oratosquilla oratoria]|uniref:uncharacterized protein LOC143039427 n=1 Tax=Oratosquilla oratoria TaxID=337810 RepID=UPI003F75C9D7
MKTNVSTLLLLVTAAAVATVKGQRIQTVEIDQNRYFISNASPYAPTLNWFLAYEYCRNIGMELVSFGQKKEMDSLNDYLRQTGYQTIDYWTSGNQLGSAMWIWMSTGQPFNTTFNAWSDGLTPLVKSDKSCMTINQGLWSANNCMDNKAFMCEQTRCFYYNYVVTNQGSQGNISTTNNRRRPTQQNFIQTTSVRPEISDTTDPDVPTTTPSEFSETIFNTTPTSTVPASSPQQNEIHSSQPSSQQTTHENIQQTLQPPSKTLEPPPRASDQPLPRTEEPPPALARLLQRKETFSWALRN